MPARKLYFEAVRVGDELPALAKAPVDRVQLVALRGRLRRLQPRARGRALRQERGHAVRLRARACWSWACSGQLVSDWARGGQLRRYNVRFIKMVWPGDTVVCKGRVTRPPRRRAAATSPRSTSGRRTRAASW